MRPSTKVSLIAQNRLLLEALTRILQKRPEFAVVYAVPYFSGMLAKIAESATRVLLVDSSVTDAFGIAVVRDALQAVPHLKVVLIGMGEDEESFVQAVTAGAVGYVLKDASPGDVVAAIRSVVQEEAVCPPRLCLSLFKYVAGTRPTLPSVRVKGQLGLTRRQQQLVPLLAQGLTNKDIALQLNLSEQTIKNHVHRMLQKLGVEDRLSAVEIVRANHVFL